MTKIQQLHEDGTMAFLVKAGLITPSAYRRLEFFVEVKALENQGVNVTRAVQEVSEKCKVCEMTVWRSLKEFTEH